MKGRRAAWLALGIGALTYLTLRYAVPVFYQPDLVRAEIPTRLERAIDPEETLTTGAFESETENERAYRLLDPKELTAKKASESRKKSLETLLAQMKQGLTKLGLDNYDAPNFTDSGETEIEGHFPGKKITIKNMSYVPEVEFSLSLEPRQQKVYLNSLRFNDEFSIRIDGSNGGLEPQVILETFRAMLPLGRKYEEARMLLNDQYITSLRQAGTEEQRTAVETGFDQQNDRMYSEHERAMRQALEKILPSSCQLAQLTEIACAK